MTLGTELTQLGDATLAALSKRDDLLSLPTNDEHQPHTGSLRDTPLVWTTRSWRGGHLFDLVRFATIEGAAMSSLTVLVVPRRALAAPVFGADLVGFGDRYTFLALDLYTLGRDLARSTNTRLAEARARLASVGRTRPREDLPFSPEAALLSVDRDADPSVVAAAYLRYLDAFDDELERPLQFLQDARDVGERQAEYARQMATHMRAVAPLRKLFGGDWIDRYFTSFFTAPARPHAVALANLEAR